MYVVVVVVIQLAVLFLWGGVCVLGQSPLADRKATKVFCLIGGWGGESGSYLNQEMVTAASGTYLRAFWRNKSYCCCCSALIAACQVMNTYKHNLHLKY